MHQQTTTPRIAELLKPPTDLGDWWRRLHRGAVVRRLLRGEHATVFNLDKMGYAVT